MSAPDRPTREQVDAALTHVMRGYTGPSTARFLAAEVRALRAELDRVTAAHARCDSAARALLDETEGRAVTFAEGRARADLVAALAARTPQPAEPTTGDLLRAAAAGRREYAGKGDVPGADDLLAEAATLECAAQVADGDMGPLYGWLPSWRWTPEMDQRVLSSTSASTSPADVAGVVLPAPLPAVPDGEDETAAVLADPDLMAAIRAGEADIAAGRLVTLDEFRATIWGAEDVPARLDAAADACANLRETPPSREAGQLLRSLASWLRHADASDARAAVAAALARPTERER